MLQQKEIFPNWSCQKKNYPRPIMTQERFSNLVLLSIKYKWFESLDHNSVNSDFIEMKQEAEYM